MKVVLGVGGGIAAYKAALLLRLFTESGHDVVPIPTEAALRFVGAPTWEALSGHPVSTDVFDRVDEVNHVHQGQTADLVVVAPATADLLARAAHGLADDLLTTTLLATRAPVLFAPAMHTEMWLNPATQANVDLLRAHGHTVLEPAVGRLTGPDSGPGRLPEPEAIHDAALRLAARDEPAAGPLAGLRVLVSAGGTREPLDPVRFLGNRSSGKQGIAVAAAARDAGADVVLVAAHLEAPVPAGVEVEHVGTAEQLRRACVRAAARADVVVMAAAVADYRPARVADAKMKKAEDGSNPVIELVRNPDVLRELVDLRNTARRRQLVVGFAAETGDDRTDPLTFGRQKLARKGCDLLAVNQVGENLVFGQDATVLTVLSAAGGPEQVLEGSKADVARGLVERIGQELAAVRA
ncbi:phosphopantothenoylcysteine decarboxylase [Kocuria dechangensis]|uniref:Coenzyme A biosynthesis bifunctional protein CoaBC n=1 Tax=Kocuria dechangensis TaxID=1176249 RepID=A0A917LV27_9MICC|nr:bifunctional phosphopantothenoylcysteine decarboxylase/phosphopantothenate--cysteine ligase CoaBC [Kocuria dechangensis]GGG59249.1 phosphopantothenoylcysteine decarboxylase [Kocuria dechangensis]